MPSVLKLDPGSSSEDVQLEFELRYQRMKEAAGRPNDMEDLRVLRKLRDEGR